MERRELKVYLRAIEQPHRNVVELPPGSLLDVDGHPRRGGLVDVWIGNRRFSAYGEDLEACSFKRLVPPLRPIAASV